MTETPKSVKNKLKNMSIFRSKTVGIKDSNDNTPSSSIMNGLKKFKNKIKLNKTFMVKSDKSTQDNSEIIAAMKQEKKQKKLNKKFIKFLTVIWIYIHLYFSLSIL